MILPMVRKVIASLFKRPFTTKYPEKKSKVSIHYRGSIHVDQKKCISCRLCEINCPTGAIVVNPKKKYSEVDRSLCILCGLCAEVCPVEAVEMIDDRAVVDLDWCIGCGVCAVMCPTGAISIKRRSEADVPKNVLDLHEKIRRERGLGG